MSDYSPRVSIREMQELTICKSSGKRGKRAKGLKPLGSVWNNIKGSVRDRDRRLKEKKAKLARKGRKKECIVHREKIGINEEYIFERYTINILQKLGYSIFLGWLMTNLEKLSVLCLVLI